MQTRQSTLGTCALRKSSFEKLLISDQSVPFPAKCSIEQIMHMAKKSRSTACGHGMYSWPSVFPLPDGPHVQLTAVPLNTFLTTQG